MPLDTSITPDRIAETKRLIRPHIRHTPILHVDLADFGAEPRPVALKLECLQHSGSFKARGAFANLLTQSIPACGVVAASGGNHGAAVAYAAMRLGVPATIFLPSVTSPAKAERVRSYAANLMFAGERYADALAASELFGEEHGALAVHAFDQPQTLLGQGTIGCEIDADLPDIDTLLVAVGGGGLIGGIAAWFRGRVKIIAVEPERSPDAVARFGGRQTGRCRDRRYCCRLAGAKACRQHHVPDRQSFRRTLGTDFGRRHPCGAARAVGQGPGGGGAGGRCRLWRPARGQIHASTGRARCGAGQRGKYDGGSV
jgi:threonine dehydratase